MEEIAPKKRGRKPKPKKNTDTINMPKKKRGRKPKNNITINKNPVFEGKKIDYIIKLDKLDKLDTNYKNNIEEYEHNEFYEISKKNNSECCWNCSNSFNSNEIFSLPIKYYNGIFYTYGDFCSRECSVRFCFDNFNNEKYEIYNLINLLFYKETGIKKSIKPAPSKLLLTKFGGNLNNSEYVETFDSRKQYIITIPPIIHFNHKVSTNEEKQINIKTNYKLFRNTPINDHNNITNIMKLQIN